MRTNIIATASVILLSLLTGCEKPGFNAVSNQKIGVRVSVQDEPQTKGKAIISDNFATEYGGFTLDCWVDSDYNIYSGPTGTTSTTITERHYINKIDAEYDSSTSEWSLATSQLWLNKVDMRFWCWAPTTSKAKGLVINPDNDSMSGQDQIEFEYTSPSAIKDQKDILFSYLYSGADQHSENGSNNTLDLKFYHALAQIRFAVSPNDGTFNTSSTDGYEIVSVALSGVPSYGECTFDGGDANASSATVPYGFTWSSQSTPASFTSSCGNYTTTAEWSEGSYTSGSNTYKLYTTKEVFFVIPNSAAGKTADITFKRKSDNELITKQVDLKDAETGDPQEWKAGMYYTYKG